MAIKNKACSFAARFLNKNRESGVKQKVLLKENIATKKEEKIIKKFFIFILEIKIKRLLLHPLLKQEQTQTRSSITDLKYF